MQKIDFKNFPDTSTPLSAQNLNQLQTNVENAITDVWKMIYPVGSIYISVNPNHPSTLFGGNWEAFGPGKVLVGQDSNDNDFKYVEAMGGKKSVKLSANIGAVNNNTASLGYIAENPTAFQGIGNPMYSIVGSNVSFDHWNHSTSVTDATSTKRETSLLQPYIVVYMWKRLPDNA